MNKSLPIILLLLSCAFGAFAIYEYQQAEHFRAVIAQMDKDAAGAREEADTQRSEIRKFKEQTHSQKVAIEQLEARNKELVNGPPVEAGKPVESGAAGDAGKDGGGNFMKSFAKMFTDPKMRDAMRAQQAMGVNMIYGDLARELGLSPDEARQVLALLADRQADMAAKGMAVMGGDKKDPATMAALGKDTAALKAGYDDQLKAMLGPDKFAKFQDYEKTTGERFALDQVQKQLTAGGMPLEASQTQGLLAIMQEERARTPNMPAANDTTAQMNMLQSDAGMDAWLNSQQDYNRRVLDRARTVLSPDQILTFESSQKQQIEMQRMGIKMSREMMKK